MSLKRACVGILVIFALSIFSVRAEDENGNGGDAPAVVEAEGVGDAGDASTAGAPASEDNSGDDDDEDEDIDSEIEGAGAPPAQPELTPEQKEKQQALQQAYVQFLMKGVSVTCRTELQAALSSQEATFTPECDAELAKVSFYCLFLTTRFACKPSLSKKSRDLITVCAPPPPPPPKHHLFPFPTLPYHGRKAKHLNLK